MMMLSLDNLAHRYGILPSEALERASTLDLRVLEVSSKWETRKQRLEKEPEKVKAEDETKKYGQDKLKEMMDSVRKGE